jgi:hypothetical protein
MLAPARAGANSRPSAAARATDTAQVGAGGARSRRDPQVRDDAHLLDLLIECAPEASARRRILVDNPAGLYGY